MKYFLVTFFFLLFSFRIYAQNDVVLISHNNYLIGAAQNGKWLRDTEVPNEFGKPSKFIGFDSFKSGEKPFEIFGTLGQLGCSANQFYFSKSSKVPEDVFADDTLKPILAIGATANWNPLPRAAQKIAATNKIYQKIALDFLKTKGIIVKTIKLENIFTVDLEGDGTNEIFLEATTYKNNDEYFPDKVRRGDYSFVMMRKIVGGKPKDFLLEGEFGALTQEQQGYLSEYDLSAFADLNGDGKMEAILEGTYSYAGTSTEIYESGKNALKKVLAIECGD